MGLVYCGVCGYTHESLTSACGALGYGQIMGTHPPTLTRQDAEQRLTDEKLQRIVAAAFGGFEGMRTAILTALFADTPTTGAT